MNYNGTVQTSTAAFTSGPKDQISKIDIIAQGEFGVGSACRIMFYYHDLHYKYVFQLYPIKNMGWGAMGGLPAELCCVHYI